MISSAFLALGFLAGLSHAWTPPSGARSFRPAVNVSTCLTAESLSAGEPVAIAMCDPDYYSTQMWNFAQYDDDPLEGGWNIQMGDLCLGVKGNNHTESAHLEINNCNNGEAQTWFPSEDGRVAWMSDQMCLDLWNAVTTPGNFAQIWPCGSNSGAQVWMFNYTSDAAATTSSAKTSSSSSTKSSSSS